MAVFAGLLLLTQAQSPAIGAGQLPGFQYRIYPGVIVGNVSMKYAPLSKPYGIKYTISNVVAGGGRMIFRMYSDGTLVWTQAVKASANGTFTQLEPAPKFTAQSKNYGPFYLCVTPLAAGIINVRPPCETWHWIPIEVPISLVSHGCSGVAAINALKKVEPGWLDKPSIPGLVIDFRDACNVLDAGYRGLTVEDAVVKKVAGTLSVPNVNKVVDFSQMDRNHVDLYFQFDLQMICMKSVSAMKGSDLVKNNAATDCDKLATRYFNAIRKVGGNFFDANPAKPGIQSTYVEPNMTLGLPSRVGRANT